MGYHSAQQILLKVVFCERMTQHFRLGTHQFKQWKERSTPCSTNVSSWDCEIGMSRAQRLTVGILVVIKRQRKLSTASRLNILRSLLGILLQLAILLLRTLRYS